MARDTIYQPFNVDTCDYSQEMHWNVSGQNEEELACFTCSAFCQLAVSSLQTVSNFALRCILHVEGCEKLRGCLGQRVRQTTPVQTLFCCLSMQCIHVHCYRIYDACCYSMLHVSGNGTCSGALYVYYTVCTIVCSTKLHRHTKHGQDRRLSPSP